MKPVFVTALLLFLTFPGVVAAVDCNEKSQNFLTQGENYFNSRDLVSFNSDSVSRIDALYEDISGKWVGNEIVTECKGSLRAMRPVRQRYNLESTVVRGDYSAIKLQKISQRDEGNVTESLDLFNFKNAVYFQDRGSKIHIVEKFYRLNSNRAQILVENLITLDLAGDRLGVTVKSYSNGSFSYLQEIGLARN